MSVPGIIIVVALALVLVESTVRRKPNRSGWGVFAGWLVAGFLSTIAAVSFALGLLIVPFAVVAIVIASRFAVWPDSSGFVGGGGLAAVVVAATNLGEPNKEEYGAWLAVGLVVLFAALVAFALVARRDSSRL